MKFKILNELNESRLVTNIKSFRKYDARDILDFTFIYFLTLQILREEVEFKSFVHDYIVKTNRASFNNYQFSQTDLYFFLHILYGLNNEESVNQLKDLDGSRYLLDEMDLPLSDVKKYLYGFSKKYRDEDVENRFLFRAEKGLRILNSNYRSVRRLIANWKDEDLENRKLIVTRLLWAFKQRMPRSDLYDKLQKLAKSQNLIVKATINPETGETINGAGLASKAKGVAKYAGLTALGSAVAGYLGYKSGYDKTKKSNWKND